jgi:type IV secretion system protein VirB9
MVVPTTRRRYELSLLSAPCRSVDDWDHNAVYTRRVRFSYPDDADWRAVQERAQEPPQVAQAPSGGGAAPAAANACGAADGALAGVAVPVERLSFDYRWERKNGFPWEPVQVFDDGVHTYIRLPEHARQFAQPILYAVEASGARLVLNYAKPDPAAPCAAPFFVTDRIVGHLALVIGSAQRGGTPQVLHVYNRRLSGGR